MMMILDRPRHDALRSRVNRARLHCRVAGLDPRIRALAKQFIDGFVEITVCDGEA